MKNTDVPVIIYQVGELKTMFRLAREARCNDMHKDPLPAGKHPLSEPCLSKQLAQDAAYGLGLLENNFKDNNAYLGFLSMPSELSKPHDPSLKPFRSHFVANDYREMTEQEAQQYPEALFHFPTLEN